MTTKTVTINTNTDFTPSQLKKWLTEKYGVKKSGRPFTNQDIYQYMRRGRLPEQYSGATIKVIENPTVGIKILRLNFKN